MKCPSRTSFNETSDGAKLTVSGSLFQRGTTSFVKKLYLRVTDFGNLFLTLDLNASLRSLSRLPLTSLAGVPKSISIQDTHEVSLTLLFEPFKFLLCLFRSEGSKPRQRNLDVALHVKYKDSSTVLGLY